MRHSLRSLVRAGTALLALASLPSAQLPEATLTPKGHNLTGYFGSHVALDGARALIGAPLLSASTGAAYVFESQSGAWVQVAMLVAGDGAPGDYFGRSVALDGERLLIAAPGDDDTQVDAGAAYVFERQAGTWIQTAKLSSGDSSVSFFGQATALDGDRALIGSFQSAFVFELQGGAWIRTAKLLAAGLPDPSLFGAAVDLSGDRALIGAGHADKAFVFELQGSQWVETAELLPVGGWTYYFGGSVSLEGDRALVGDVQEMDLGSGLGTARVFDYVGGAWVQSALLVPTDPAPYKRFAASVSLRGDRVLVGAPGELVLPIKPGTAYLFERTSGGAWTQLAKLFAPVPEDYASFGESVSLGDGRALVGAPGADPGGAAYLIDVSHAGDALQASPPLVSLGAGGVQHLALNAGPAHGGKLYWLFGSASGTAPGVPLGGGLVLPLNPDAYFAFTQANPDTMPLAHSLGVLGVAGQSSAAFWIPAGTDPSLAGLVAHHAYAVIDLVGLVAAFASNPVAVQLGP